MTSRPAPTVTAVMSRPGAPPCGDSRGTPSGAIGPAPVDAHSTAEQIGRAAVAKARTRTSRRAPAPSGPAPSPDRAGEHEPGIERTQPAQPPEAPRLSQQVARILHEAELTAQQMLAEAEQEASRRADLLITQAELLADMIRSSAQRDAAALLAAAPSPSQTARVRAFLSRPQDGPAQARSPAVESQSD